MDTKEILLELRTKHGLAPAADLPVLRYAS